MPSPLGNESALNSLSNSVEARIRCEPAHRPAERNLTAGRDYKVDWLLNILLLTAAYSQSVLAGRASTNTLTTKNKRQIALPLFQDAGRGGITHIQLASEKLGGHQDSVMLHLFLRAIASQQQILIRGIGFVETIDEIKMDMMHLTQPNSITSWKPRIRLVSVDEGYVQAISVDLAKTRDDPWRPFHLETTLSSSIADSAFRLLVDDWRRYGFYYPRAHVIREMVSRPMSYHVVLSTFFRNQRSAMINLMLKHMEYHARLGFTKHLVYVHSDFLKVMLEDSSVLASIQTGSLELVYWDLFGGYDTPVWEYATQALMYNHALLTMWGESIRLAFIDLDEYLAVPHVLDISLLYSTCFEPGELQILRRFDALCSSCKAGTSELSIWGENDVYTALSHYTLLRFDGGGVSLDLGKCIADADHVHSFFVHDAVPNRNAQLTMVPQSCAFLVHFVSMVEARASPEGFVPDTSWHWFVGQNSTIGSKLD